MLVPGLTLRSLLTRGQAALRALAGLSRCRQRPQEQEQEPEVWPGRLFLS